MSNTPRPKPFVKSANNERLVKDDKALMIVDSTITIIDAASKMGVRLLATYIFFDTWRKIAINLASKK